MKKQQKLKPHLKHKDIKVYRDALEKHSWDVHEAFNELFLKREVEVKNREQSCQVIRNFEIIKECFGPINAARSNTTLPIVQASSTIWTGGKEDENLQIGMRMEEAGSCEQQHVLAEEIDALLSPEHRDLVSHELQTMISNLSSQLVSFLPALEPDRVENSRVKGIQIATGDTGLMGAEAKFKWSHFETALKVIQGMLFRAPSIELADDVDYIVDTKIVKGSYDFSQDESVDRFKEKVLQYTTTHNLFRNDHQARKEQLQKEIESEIESMKIIFETESDKIEQKINSLDKAGSTIDTKLFFIKQDLEKTIELKKWLECELANLVTKHNQLNSDLERYQSEKNNMVTHQNELKKFVRGNLGEYRRHAERIEEKQRCRLRNLDRILVQKEERNKRELEMLKMVILRTSIQNPVSPSGSKNNPIMVKDE